MRAWVSPENRDVSVRISVEYPFAIGPGAEPSPLTLLQTSLLAVRPMVNGLAVLETPFLPFTRM
jgi:hypothetical protein